MRMRLGGPRARQNSAVKVSRSGFDRQVTSHILLYYCLCMSMSPRKLTTWPWEKACGPQRTGTVRNMVAASRRRPCMLISIVYE
jgi:hypothetical protein